MESPKSPKRESPNGKQRLLNFLRGLLDDPTKTDCIIWVKKEEQVFKLMKPHQVASMWGAATGNPTMTYDKMSRGLRYFYQNETLRKIPGKDSRYQFIEPEQATPMPLFNIANLLTPKAEAGTSSLPTSPTSSSSGSASTSPPQLKAPLAPIAPMPNLLATMDFNQLMGIAQILSAQFNTFKAEHPVIQTLPDHAQIQVYLNFRTQFPMLFPAIPN